MQLHIRTVNIFDISQSFNFVTFLNHNFMVKNNFYYFSLLYHRCTFRHYLFYKSALTTLRWQIKRLSGLHRVENLANMNYGLE